MGHRYNCGGDYFSLVKKKERTNPSAVGTAYGHHLYLPGHQSSAHQASMRRPRKCLMTVSECGKPKLSCRSVAASSVADCPRVSQGCLGTITRQGPDSSPPESCLCSNSPCTSTFLDFIYWNPGQNLLFF